MSEPFFWATRRILMTVFAELDVNLMFSHVFGAGQPCFYHTVN